MSEMEVCVTPAQFYDIKKLAIRLESEPWCREEMIGLLSLCTLANGGDFDPARCRAMAPTKITVIWPA